MAEQGEREQTAKQRVLAVYPKAYLMDHQIHWVKVWNGTSPISSACLSEDGAFEDAASRLPKSEAAPEAKNLCLHGNEHCSACEAHLAFRPTPAPPAEEGEVTPQMFKQWAESRDMSLERNSKGDYAYVRTQAASEGWNASRAAMEGETPEEAYKRGWRVMQERAVRLAREVFPWGCDRQVDNIQYVPYEPIKDVRGTE